MASGKPADVLGFRFEKKFMHGQQHRAAQRMPEGMQRMPEGMQRERMGHLEKNPIYAPPLALAGYARASHATLCLPHAP